MAGLEQETDVVAVCGLTHFLAGALRSSNDDDDRRIGLSEVALRLKQSGAQLRYPGIVGCLVGAVADFRCLEHHARSMTQGE